MNPSPKLFKSRSELRDPNPIISELPSDFV